MAVGTAGGHRRLLDQAQPPSALPASPFAGPTCGYGQNMTDNDNNGVWRDEERLPLSELDKAIATSPGDGQVDDATGSEAGAEEEFGDAAVAADGRAAPVDNGRDMTDPDRMYRPGTTGRSGPN